ncbi:serine-rich coiled-coil domain-containing protein 1 [Electrophorus electricus]|uniref:serine-rich coiled-coil domain-containing protein 1 n=1 Tax=Electrophorus electricus TaxID=8005 RepID=UPI0015CFB7B7|nr:serine-rich coiled-coil domain-containing protein 1 [Electrophorus electricus]
MGESGPRRSTLVSRLPIFRRSVSKRQDSLPSSPSSGGVGNGLHTSSPSSTNSSSSSTGKRRSLFRAPAIGFHGRRSGGPCADPASLSLDGRSQASELGLAAGCDSKVRHSFGFGRHRKRMSRSQTEDLEKASGNRNVFINCISSGTNEGDDSGFLDDGSSKRSSRHRKQLLPKSFSAHHRFSKNSFNVPEQGKSQEEVGEPPKTGTPGSWPGELAESSLQSPMISEDRTTAVTPSDFVHITEDSVSEVDALPAPSPAAPPETSGHDAPTSCVCFSPGEAATEQPLLLDASHPANGQCESTAVYAEPATLQTVEEIHLEKQEAGGCEQAPEPSEESSSNPEPRERKPRNPVLIQQVGKLSGLAKLESKPRHPRKPHTVSMCSSSPYHDVMRMEKRLRSASEGAGGPRLHLNLREPHCLETSTLAEQRTNSSSSKMGSLDFMLNFGSSELDEDDLMLDLELSDDQRQRHASQEDSSQSLASCLNLLPSPLEPTADQTPAKESREHNREPRPRSLCLPRDDDPPASLEALPFRQMQQDCTATKTLLLRLRRLLQESTETSPASSLHSLPISPCSEKSLLLKDPGSEECQSLQQQLKERDELILRLQAELEVVRNAQKTLCQKADKTTQTDLAVSERRDSSGLVNRQGEEDSWRGRKP